MALLSKWLLQIQDKDLANKYRLQFTRRILAIGILILLMRITVFIVLVVLDVKDPRQPSRQAFASLYIATPIQFGLSFLILAASQWKPLIFNDVTIPVIIALNYIIINPNQPMNVATFVFEAMLFQAFWFVHICSTNCNWIPTSFLHGITQLYLVVVYFTAPMNRDLPALKAIYTPPICFVTALYLWMGYYIDKQLKQNFCQNQTLLQQKENLKAILAFFPESLMIIKQAKGSSQTTEILYQNEPMKNFSNLAQDLIFDEITNTYFKKEESLHINDQLQKILSERLHSTNDNQPMLIEEPRNRSPSLKDYLMYSERSEERIRVQNEHRGANDSIDSNYDNVYEYKSKEVIFDEQVARLVIVRDVSELIKNEYARTVEKMTEIMVASTSHDMRTPLNTIINMNQLIQSRSQDPQVKSWLQVSSNSTNLLLFLVNDTLDFFQIKSGRFELKDSYFNLQEMVESTFDLVSIQMNLKKLQRIIEFDPELLKVEVFGDRQRLSQILVNLLSNALKFTLKGYIKVKVSKIDEMPVDTQLPLNCSGQQAKVDTHFKILVEVEDSGLGIKESDKGKLFKMFGKLQQSGKDVNPTGIGLGLTICNNILNQYGSELKVKSQFGHGATFYFFLDLPVVYISTYKSPKHLPERDYCSYDVSVSSFRSTALHQYNLIEGANPSVFDLYKDGSWKMNMKSVNDRLFETDGRCQVLNKLSLFQKPLEETINDEESIVVSIRIEDQEESKCDCEERLPKVLIVDDSEFNIFSLQTILNYEYEIKADTAYNGEEAIELIKQRIGPTRLCQLCDGQQYQVIFMDIEMPMMDGYAATEALREYEKKYSSQAIGDTHAYVIGLTGHTSEIYKIKCMDYGMDDYMTKPVESARLRQVLHDRCLI